MDRHDESHRAARGTDLGLLKTRAEPNDDGTYSITGTKIFISSGEHDLSENIIHLVLAKRPDAPDSVKGISLFVVPKFLVNDDGWLGERNAVSCGALEKKMGIHGNATCVMNYDGAKGWLVGEGEKGLQAMFIMMNAARLGVGCKDSPRAKSPTRTPSATLASAGRAVRSTSASESRRKADPIIVHPDVRRMLMEAQAWNEAARALCLWGSLLVDLVRRSPDEEERNQADDLLGLITPVIKGYLTDKGFEAAVYAQQVFGGHGYIREHGMEQFVRDARITQIYEGTNGIQAMDLVGRKLPREGGRAVRAFLELVGGGHCRGEGRMAIRPGSPRRSNPRSGPSGRDHVARPERHGRPRQCRCRRLFLHGPDGPRDAGLDVAQDGGGRRAGARRARARRTASSTRPSSPRRAFMPSANCRCRRRFDGRSKPAPTR